MSRPPEPRNLAVWTTHGRPTRLTSVAFPRTDAVPEVVWDVPTDLESYPESLRGQAKGSRTVRSVVDDSHG